MARSHLLTPTIFQREVLPSYSTTGAWLGLASGTLSHQFESRCCIPVARCVEPRVWVNRLTAALDRRHGLVDDPLTTAWRWVHGENDGLPGLVLDRYVDTLVIKLYSGAWYPHLGDIIAAAQRYCRARGLFFAALGECPLRPVLRVMGMCSLVRGLMEP